MKTFISKSYPFALVLLALLSTFNANASPVNDSLCALLSPDHTEFHTIFVGDSSGNGMYNITAPFFSGITESSREAKSAKQIKQLDADVKSFQEAMANTCSNNKDKLSTYDLVDELRKSCSHKCDTTFPKGIDVGNACYRTCENYSRQLNMAGVAFEQGFTAGRTAGFNDCESAAISKARTILPKAQLDNFNSILDRAKAAAATKAQ